MIVGYKGFEIDVTRDSTMVGEALFLYINRIYDGYLIYEDIDYVTDKSLRVAIKNLKKWIDEEYHELKYRGVEPDTDLYNELLEHEENNILYPR